MNILVIGGGSIGERHLRCFQTTGRAARNVEGHVILYADRTTNGMQAAIRETRRRRENQARYNAELDRLREQYGVTDEADREFQRALQLNPGSADIHRDYGFFLVGRVRDEEAILEMRRAVESK